eukprot:gene26346-biopygen15989
MSRGGCSRPKSWWNRSCRSVLRQSCDARVKTHSSAHLVER